MRWRFEIELNVEVCIPRFPREAAAAASVEKPKAFSTPTTYVLKVLSTHHRVIYSPDCYPRSADILRTTTVISRFFPSSYFLCKAAKYVYTTGVCYTTYIVPRVYREYHRLG